MVTYFRRLPKFDYVKPAGIDEVLDLLESNQDGKCRVYAGGTDVIPKLKTRAINSPEILIDLKGIPGLDFITYDDEIGLRIGALATVYSVAHSRVVKDRYPILAQAAGSIASTQVQNRATLVGNICNAVPSADSAPALLCLDATLDCVSKKGERTIRIGDFFLDPNKTSLRADELVREIRIPPSADNSNGVYLKLSSRQRMDLAVVGVAAFISTDGGRVKSARVGLGAVAPTPMRAKKAEEILQGEVIDEKVISRAAKAASEESRPIDDHRASAEYRKIMVDVLVRRGILQVMNL
ncbi:MAG: xanthine dehydrogenase family protein subunit M [Deltaproteobacteria bacterium]|nr:xanthine dehydrogenase family protein subunit M [Deltaproteobacteria bacterium]